MNGDISGVPSALNNSKALETDPRQQSPFSWDGVYRFPLGQSVLELPDDDDLKSALLGIYLASGFTGVAVAWETVRAALDSFGTPSHEERLIAELRTGYGTAAEYDKQLVDFQADFLDKNRHLVSGKTLVESRERNAQFRQRVVNVIDDILSAEEEAQRWYESKLLELIDLHLAHQKKLIVEAWTTTYQIGWGGKNPPEGAVRIDDDVSSATLRIRSTRDMVEVEQFTAGATIQGGTTTKIKVPAVIAALHQVGSLYFKYKGELEGRIKANKERRRVGAAALAIADLSSYKDFTKALREQGARHFIIWATFRDVIEGQQIETAFTQKMQVRCERLIIDGLREAWQNCGLVTANANSDRLFKDEQPMCMIGKDDMGVPASSKAVAAAYQRTPAKGKTLARMVSPAEISRSPWLQAPFHGLMVAVATNELAAATTAKLPVDHLLPLFKDANDRNRLLALKAVGSFVSRAREEMVNALVEKADLDESVRQNIALAIAGLGLVAAPFTAGASLLVAGIVDAALVAEKTSSQIAQWIAADQYSAIVVDEMTGQAWREPAVSELMGLVFEGGFQIAGDLAQGGAVARFFAAVGLSELLAAGAGLAIGALTPSASVE